MARTIVRKCTQENKDESKPFCNRNSPALCFLIGTCPLALSAASFCFCFTLNSLIIVSPILPAPWLTHNKSSITASPTTTLNSMSTLAQKLLHHHHHRSNKTLHHNLLSSEDPSHHIVNAAPAIVNTNNKSNHLQVGTRQRSHTYRQTDL